MALQYHWLFEPKDNYFSNFAERSIVAVAIISNITCTPPSSSSPASSSKK